MLNRNLIFSFSLVLFLACSPKNHDTPQPTTNLEPKPHSQEPESTPEVSTQPPSSEHEGTDNIETSNRDHTFTEVTDAFGPLAVTPGEFEAVAPVKPWSAWWLPMYEKYLFEGNENNLSPLEKYDLYEASQGRPTQAARHQRDHHYNPNADSWEGLCNAWALASLMEPEPTKPVTVRDLTFGVGDQKALLIMTYERADKLKKFGQRYNGNSSSVYLDLYPDQFHRFLQYELFENHRAFIIDKDPGIAVWNTPIWKAFVRIKPDASGKVLHVESWLVGADPHVANYDDIGTKEVTYDYTYDLNVISQDDGSFKVIDGVWTSRSVEDHPDFVTVVPDKVETKSSNVEVSQTEVRKILALPRRR